MMFVFGKLHPLFVHLPIGFLLIGFMLHIWQTLKPTKDFSNVLAPIFGLGALSAILSCITGLLLMNGGEYDLVTLERHRNSGISLAILSIYVWFIYQRNTTASTKHFFSVALVVLLFVTGHYGGTLTHGSQFLSLSATDTPYKEPEIKNVDEAIVYQDLIEPIFQKKCVSCHGPEKMKGNLRLDNASFFEKGGKHGSLTDGESSLLVQRLLLPLDHEEHMPPKEKGQLTNDEIALIKWWINAGANMNAKVATLPKDSAVLSYLKRKPSTAEPVAIETLPIVDPADPKILTELRKAGISISPVSAESNLLIVNTLNIKDSSIQTWNVLAKIAPQLFSLKAELPFITDEHIRLLSAAKQLRKLSVKGSKITDASFDIFKQFPDLASLNVSHTAVTLKGLSSLSQQTKLRYLYMIGLKDSTIQLNIANVEIISKPFQVPTLETDTSIVKEATK